MRGLNANAAKAAPVGATSAFVLAVVTVCCVAFFVLSHFSNASAAGLVAAVFIIAAYFLFSPAVAGSVYSLLFESRKAFGLVGFGIAGLALLTALILADGLLLLPFWLLAIIGVTKFFRWRRKKPCEHT